MYETQQALFDANHLMIAGTLAHHWTEQACKDWMAAQKELPWRIHIGCDGHSVFSMQMLNVNDNCAHPSFSIFDDGDSWGAISPSFPHVRLSSLETLARETRKERRKPSRE